MMITDVQERGPKYVSGHLDSGRLVLVREDGSKEPQPVILIRASIIDNGDGTVNITPTEE